MGQKCAAKKWIFKLPKDLEIKLETDRAEAVGDQSSGIVAEEVTEAEEEEAAAETDTGGVRDLERLHVAAILPHENPIPFGSQTSQHAAAGRI